MRTADKCSYSITHEEDENGTFFVTIHKNELLVGGAELSYTPSGWQADHLWVCDNHQRRGLATKMYDLVESTTGLPVLPSDVQTEDAKLFWESRLSKTKAPNCLKLIQGGNEFLARRSKAVLTLIITSELNNQSKKVG